MRPDNPAPGCAHVRGLQAGRGGPAGAGPPGGGMRVRLKQVTCH